MVYISSIMSTKQATHRSVAIRVETIEILDKLRGYTRRSRPDQIHVLVEQALGERPAEQLQHIPRIAPGQEAETSCGAGGATVQSSSSPAPSPITTGGSDG